MINSTKSRPGINTEEHFDRLLDAHGATLLQAIRKTCPKDLERLVADIEQDARLRLWKAMKTERTIRDPKSYIYRLGVNAALDAVNRTLAREETAIESADPPNEGPPGPWLPTTASDPEKSVQRRELMEALETCLARLPENRRLAVRLYIQGFSVNEVAELSGWSQAKARNLTYRGRDDLRRFLRAGGIEYETEA